jgi:hypothetical protein
MGTYILEERSSFIFVAELEYRLLKIVTMDTEAGIPLKTALWAAAGTLTPQLHGQLCPP